MLAPSARPPAPRATRLSRVAGTAADGVSRVVRRVLGAKASPTSDLYLGWSCADLIGDGTIRQIAPTVFQSAGTLIVLRHDGALDRLPDHDRLILVMDDDWRAGISDPGLPTSYRAKLALVEAAAARRLEACADVIVAASEVLAARYRALLPGRRVLRLDPVWPPATAKLPCGTGVARRIACLGAISHRADLDLIGPAVIALRAGALPFHLTLSGNHPFPRAWRADPRIEILPALSWPAYRAWMVGQRFDIGLVPLRETAFNRSRSINKLLEYDQFGAAVLAPAGWAGASLGPDAGLRCGLVDGGAEAWSNAVSLMMQQRGLAHDLAAHNRTAITAAEGQRQQRAFWVQLLNNTGHPCRS